MLDLSDRIDYIIILKKEEHRVKRITEIIGISFSVMKDNSVDSLGTLFYPYNGIGDDYKEIRADFKKRKEDRN